MHRFLATVAVLTLAWGALPGRGAELRVVVKDLVVKLAMQDGYDIYLKSIIEDQVSGSYWYGRCRNSDDPQYDFYT